jgi:hypothetical protein
MCGREMTSREQRTAGHTHPTEIKAREGLRTRSMHLHIRDAGLHVSNTYFEANGIRKHV